MAGRTVIVSKVRQIVRFEQALSVAEGSSLCCTMSWVACSCRFAFTSLALIIATRIESSSVVVRGVESSGCRLNCLM